MAIFNSSLLFLLLITALLAFIIGWLSRKLTGGDSENILKQKMSVLRSTIAEQKEELSGVSKISSASYSDLSIDVEPNETEELVELRLKNQKLLDSENDLKVKLSQLYTKKQAEINQLSFQIESLKARLDNIKGESTLEVDEPEVEFPLSDDKMLLEIESQKQTIGRLENQLKIEADIYKKRIDELESKPSEVVETNVNNDDSNKLKALSERLAAKDAELIAMQDEIKEAKKQFNLNTKAPVKKKVSKKKTTKTAPTSKPATKKVTKKKVAKKVAKKTSKKVQTKKKVVSKDDLTQINGIGPKIKTLLYKNGITSFAQIAALKAADVRTLADKLGNFRDRIKRDEWVKQAKKLAK